MIRWTVVLAVFLALANIARAAGPDDQYLEIYNQILQADGAEQSGYARSAAVQFLGVQRALTKFKAEYPTWNPEVVNFRLEYAGEHLQKLQQYLPVPKTAAAQTPAAPVPAPATNSGPSPEVIALHQQIQTLLAANTDLENRLKEALSVQPAAVSPIELSKAQEKITALEKERDLLKVALDQAKAAAVPPPAAADASDIVRQLKKELAAREQELGAVQKHHNRELDETRAALKDAQEANAELRKKLDAAVAPAPVPTENPADRAELEQLRSELAALDAKAVPYTPEELAMLKRSQPAAAAQFPPPGAVTPAPASKRVGHSKEDLPPGAGALMAEATRAVMARDFPEAESKLREILHQDENNVYVLAYLANAQLGENHLDDCDKTVQRALQLDPNDPASLYLLGVVRYQQARYDEALAALSRSAQLNPTNSSTQNYLGCVLAEKGQRSAAETALRKALQVDPLNAEANYNLAFVYATEKPPSPQLALWHYQRAVSLGHAKNAALEKMLPTAN